MPPCVVCCGIAVLDRVHEMPALPDGPGKTIATGYRETGGGMGATAAVAIAALGGAARWCGRLGDDAVGQWLLARFARAGVDTGAALVTPDATSAVSGVFVDAEGERILAVFPGVGLPEEANYLPSLLDGAGAVLADPRWPQAAERLFELASARGLPRVLDADIAPDGLLHRLAPQADHVVFSQRGLLDFSGTPDPRQGLALVAAQLRGTVAVTLGAEGSLWWQDGAAAHVPAPHIAARDTTGCGDVFHGAYALALAEGQPVQHAARFATAAAALKAQRGHGWDGMPNRAAVQALLAAP